MIFGRIFKRRQPGDDESHYVELAKSSGRPLGSRFGWWTLSPFLARPMVGLRPWPPLEMVIRLPRVPAGLRLILDP
jgi:hypothetical protein